MLTRWLCLFSFCSGFAALVYQVAWAKMLSLSFGNSTLAVSAVVAGFMGGMGIGAWLYHRIGERFRAALRAYAFLELAIAVSTALFTMVFQLLPHWFAAAASALPAGLGMDLFRILCGFLLLLVPSAFMGATYPALCTAMIHSRPDVDKYLGVIYGLNTLGAAAGALATGVLLAELLGLRGSVWVANGINLCIGIGAWQLARGGAVRFRAVGEAGADDEIPTALPWRITAVVLFGSGFATLCYEIVWFRALRYLVGNSTYALTNVLVIFLLGLGLGALAYRFAVRLGRPERNLAFCQLGIAALALVAIASEQWLLGSPALRDHVSIFSPIFRTQPWQARLLTSSTVALAIMLPATLLMGLSFPLASRLFLGSVRALGSRVGLAYLLANLGGILGAILAAVWVLPQLGTVGGTWAVAFVNLGLGLLVLAWDPVAGGRMAVAVGSIAVVTALGLALPARLGFEGEELSTRMVAELVFEEEGDLGTVQVRVNPARREHRAMTIDGTIVGVGPGFYPSIYGKQILLAHLPMALSGEMRHTLNVGLASATTLAALASYHEVESLDVVEINPAVVRGARFFEESSVLEDPRTEIVIEDAVHYLLRTPKTYDLVVSDGKQNMDFSGNAKILSLEFYEYALARLGACGLFIQWIPLLNDSESFAVMLRTFSAAFPEVEILFAPPSSVFMVGSRCSLASRSWPDRSGRAASSAARDLEENGLPALEHLPALWIASGSDLGSVLGEGPINAWDRMPLEFSSYRSTTPQRSAGTVNLRLLLSAREAGSKAKQAGMGQSGAASESMLELQRAYLLAMEGDVSEAKRLARKLLGRGPLDAMVKKALREFEAFGVDR